jgi:hypothetical protein
MKSTTSVTPMLLAFFLLIAACSSSQVRESNATINEANNPGKVFIPNKQH